MPLWLVVVRGLGEKPMMLLTNLSLRKNRKVLWWVVSAYLTVTAGRAYHAASGRFCRLFPG